MNRIFPRNLTARAAMQIAGNPVSTRLESGVSNCFPGLEFDQRNLDRRFFPGLLFEFIDLSDDERPVNARRGARLIPAGIDPNDPEFAATTDRNQAAALRRALRAASRSLRSGTWFLH